MRVTFERRVLLRALETLKKIVPAQSSVPILQYVFLQFRDPHSGLAQLFGTNLDVYACIEIPCTDVHGYAEECCLDHRELLKALEGKGDLVQINYDVDTPYRAAICCNNRTVNITAQKPTDFPAAPAMPSADWGISTTGDMMERVQRLVRPRVTKDETRIHYTQVCIDVSETDAVTWVATDGVVAISTLADQDAAVGGLEAVKPSKDGKYYPRAYALVQPVALDMLQKHGLGPDSAVKFQMHKHHGVRIEAPGIWMQCRMVEGPFAPWRRVIPADSSLTTKYLLPAKDFAQAIAGARSKARDTAADQGRFVLMQTGIGYGRVITVDGPKLATESFVPWSATPEGDTPMCASADFLHPAISGANGIVCARGSTPLSPWVFTSGDPGWIYVQSVMHLPWDLKNFAEWDTLQKQFGPLPEPRESQPRITSEATAPRAAAKSRQEKPQAKSGPVVYPDPLTVIVSAERFDTPRQAHLACIEAATAAQDALKNFPVKGLVFSATGALMFECVVKLDSIEMVRDGVQAVAKR